MGRRRHFMTTAPAFGLEGNPSFMSPDNLDAKTRELNEKDRDILLDYLEKYIGPDVAERAVLEEETAPRDEAVLSKAMFIEYQFPNTAKMVHRTTQEVAFDSKGNVWVAQTKKPGAVIWLDPRTAATRDYPTPNPNWSPHGLAVDADDSIWWSGDTGAGLAHMDPQTGSIDVYGDPGKKKGGLYRFLIPRAMCGGHRAVVTSADGPENQHDEDMENARWSWHVVWHPHR